MGCIQFFLHKETKDEEKVRKVAWGMQDPIIQDWYLNDQEHMDKLTFKEYLAEGQYPFKEWAVKIQSQNTLLRGTTSHLDDVNLLYHLKLHMNSDLTVDYYAEEIMEKVLHKWIEKVHLLDEKQLRYLTRQKEAIDAALHAECARSRANKKTARNAHSNTKATNGQSKDNASTKTFTRLPALTDAEHQLLHDNDGCFKCCELFAGHTSSNCPKGFPDGTTYKTLTAAVIIAKKSKKDGGVVTSVDVKGTDNTIAVVMPSAVLGNGTDSGESVAPLQTPLLRWNCLLDGPVVTSPISCLCLLTMAHL
ncbi:hypothetical protein BDR05DRAFT_996297 [Suillus weaverae]|nr:hypothetical protein BDR05DRAFT_996297 [Suillus weaverae]